MKTCIHCGQDVQPIRSGTKILIWANARTGGRCPDNPEPNPLERRHEVSISISSGRSTPEVDSKGESR